MKRDSRDAGAGLRKRLLPEEILLLLSPLRSEGWQTAHGPFPRFLRWCFRQVKSRIYFTAAASTVAASDHRWRQNSFPRRDIYVPTPWDVMERPALISAELHSFFFQRFRRIAISLSSCPRISRSFASVHRAAQNHLRCLDSSWDRGRIGED